MENIGTSGTIPDPDYSVSSEKELVMPRVHPRWKLGFIIVCCLLGLSLVAVVLLSLSFTQEPALAPTTDRTTPELPLTYPATSTSALPGHTSTSTRKPSTPAGVTEISEDFTTTAERLPKTTEGLRTTSRFFSTTRNVPTPPPILPVSNGDPFTLLVPVHEMYHVTFIVNGQSDITIQLLSDVAAEVTVGVYGRLGSTANFAQYDIHQVFGQDDLVQFLYQDAGEWFLGFYNGGSQTVELNMVINAEASSVRCENDCSLKGICDNGVCQCMQGWTGEACEIIDRVPCMPNNCTENGRFEEGECHCDPGWSGEYCELKECVPMNCSDQGDCVDGVCVCDVGWQGSACDEVDCIPSDCSGHGVCVDGSCHCNSDWQGDICDIAFVPCPDDCSGHGDCDNVTGICTCREPWTSYDCSIALCVNCSEFSECNNGSCVCYPGYTGVTCTEKLCHAACYSNGYCVDGECICDIGWVGQDCHTNACPRNCSSTGECAAISGGWKCQCDIGYDGPDCSIGKEVICDDGSDDDNDGLVDCLDPDCCTAEVCVESENCQTVSDPIEVAPPLIPGRTPNFYDRIGFLVGENGTQIGAEPGVFNPELVCVLRGSVLTKGRAPHPGVQVAIKGNPQFGYTLSRADGRFDLVLNCGGRESLDFSKTHFIPGQRTLDTAAQTFRKIEPDVILIPLDTKVTEVESGSSDVQEVAGSMVTDMDGSRQVVMLFKPNTTISILTDDGEQITLDSANLRVTEFTVGESGMETMPAPMPPSVAYTYAIEMSIDELDVSNITNASSNVLFNQPVPFFTDNFLGFPVGSPVPVGYLDRSRGLWVAEINGRVVEVTAPGNASAMVGLDVTGSGRAGTLEELQQLGVTVDELEMLSRRYVAGQQLWRVQIKHLTPWDCNWSYCPPPGSCSPTECDELQDPESGCSNPSEEGDSEAMHKQYRRSLSLKPKRRIRKAWARNQDDDSHKRATVIGEHLKPPMNIESWHGVDPSSDNAETCPVVRGACGLIYRRDINTQNPSRLDLTIPGTDIRLIYNDFRQKGYKPVIKIPLSGPNFPEHARGISREVQTEGVTHVHEFPPEKNLTDNFVWDRLDAYGRPVHGDTTANVAIGYKYDLVYCGVEGEFDASFNRFSDADLDVHVDRSSMTATFTIDKEVVIPENTLPDVGLGGWTLSNHHSYDTSTGTVYLGDTERYKVNSETDLRTAVGTGQSAPGCQACGEGIGTEASITAPINLVESATGKLYFADNEFIRVLVNGNVSTLTTLPWSVRLRYFMALNPIDGSLLISDPNTLRLYSVPTQGPDAGQLNVIAGTGAKCQGWEAECGDGGLALESRFTSLRGVACGSDGNIFVVDSTRIRQIGSDGKIVKYVGSNRRQPIKFDRLSDRYTQPFDQLTFVNPTKILVDKHETMYIVDQAKVIRLSKDGRATIVAGVPEYKLTGGYQSRNPSGKANEHEFHHSLQSIALNSGGNLYISESNMDRGNKVYRVNPQDNSISHVVGIESSCGCSSSSCQCYGGEGKFPLDEPLYAPTDLVFTSKGYLVIGDQGNRRLRTTRVLSLNNVVAEGEIVVPDPSQTELYIFNSNGYHQRTLHAFSKTVKAEFRYSEDMKLQAIVDAYNRTLTIERWSDGRLRAFVAPTGESSYVTLDLSGMLKEITDPLGISTSFGYSSDGLVLVQNPPNGCQQSYEYDSYGRLSKIFRGQDIVQEFKKSSTSDGIDITESTTLTGRKYVSTRQTTDGLVTQVDQLGVTGQIVEQYTESKETFITRTDGVVTHEKTSPGAIWGTTAPILTYSSSTTPGGRKRVLEYSETATMPTGDPLTTTLVIWETKLHGELVHSLEINMVEKTSSSFYYFDGSKVLYTKTWHDEAGIVVTISRPWLGIADSHITHGHNSYLERRESVWAEVLYDENGNVISDRSFDGIVRMYGYNEKEQHTTTTFPSGKVIQFEYDECNKLSSVIMPGGSRHGIATKPGYHKSDLVYSHEASNASHIWQISPDSELVKKTDQSGQSTINTYDEGYRPTSVIYESHTIAFSYTGGSMEPSMIRRYANDILDSEIERDFDGHLLMRMVVLNAGDVIPEAEFVYDYSPNFWLTEIHATVIDSEFSSFLEMNEAGFITRMNNFLFSRRSDANDEMTDGVITCIYEHNSVGFLTGHNCKIMDDEIFTYTLTMAQNTTKVEQRSIHFANTSEIIHEFIYDIDGQLVEVRQDGDTGEMYDYDLNGNRVSWQSDGSSHVATYDRQDIISSVDGKPILHTASGFLEVSPTASYIYSAKGELERAVVNDVIIDYRYDGLNRLISKVKEGEEINFYYGNPLNSLHPSHVVRNGEVMALLFSKQQGLYAIETEDSLFYVMSDHLRTPLAVFDRDGQLVKRVIYDSYGVLISETNPSFYLPIGFGGGIYDYDTTMTHFHFRDYLANVGRWSSRDPSYFGSGQPNLYQYVFNDPINLRDPLGLWCVGISFAVGVGVGGDVCWDETGFTACAGVVTGASFGVTMDPDGKPKSESGMSVEAEATSGYTLKAFGTGIDASVGIKYDSDNGKPWDQCAYKLSASLKVSTVGVETGYDASTNLGDDPNLDLEKTDPTVSGNTKAIDIGAGSSVSAKACVTV